MEDKKKTVKIGDYLLAKNGKTKYIKLQANPNGTDTEKAVVDALIKALGTDRLYVNLFDQEFKDEKGIPDFVKGKILVDLSGLPTDVVAKTPAAVGSPQVQTQAKAAVKSKTVVDF